jgi:hypothetical protein
LRLDPMSLQRLKEAAEKQKECVFFWNWNQLTLQ